MPPRRVARSSPVGGKSAGFVGGRNLAVAALSAAALRLTEKPVVEPLAELVERERLGLVKRLNLPGWLEVPLAVALMDYTLYIWHILVHKVPFL